MVKRSDVWEASRLSEQYDNLTSAIDALKKNNMVRHDTPRETMCIDIYFYDDESGPTIIPEKLEVSIDGLLALLEVRREYAAKRLTELGVLVTQ